MNKKPTVNDIPDDFMECRDVGHSWKPFDGGCDKRKRLYHRTHRCRGCRTYRTQILSWKGEILTSSYTYAKDYLFKGSGRYDQELRGKVRVHNTREFIEQHSEPSEPSESELLVAS